MNSDTVQARYDELDRVAARFGKASAASADLHTRISRCVETLERGGWQGRGADAFFAEMHHTLYPTIQRLVKALDDGRAVTLQAKEILRAAEEEASRLFNKQGSGAGSQQSESVPELVLTPPGTFDQRRSAYNIGTPQEIANYHFRSGSSTALKYDVEINGRKIPIYMSKNPGHPDRTHTIDEVAKGLAALPESSRSIIKEVNVEPNRNPDDAYWAKQYHDPNFYSYMTAGASGVVSIYPTQAKQSQDSLDGAIHHETGHTLSHQKWGSDTNDKRWNGWKSAMSSDVNVASKYAQNSPSEDFAETYKLYHQVKGTPQEAVYRSRLPDRFRIIDDIEAKRR